MLSRLAAGVMALLHEPHSGYPFKLFGLLADDEHTVQQLAHEIDHDPECLKCDFTINLLKKFFALRVTPPAQRAKYQWMP